MLTWHGSAELKTKTVAAMKQSREEDRFIQGKYFKLDWNTENNRPGTDFRGCALGCLVAAESKAFAAFLEQTGDSENWHDVAEELYGIHAGVARRIDDLFEALPVSDCASFAVDVLEAIPVGVELDYSHFAYEQPKIYDARTEAAEFIALLKTAS